MRKNRLDNFIQLIIPPALVVLLVFTIIELFYGFGRYSILIDVFDLFVIIIFSIDLRFRWKERESAGQYFKKHFLDIIATIPFNYIFLGLESLALARALRGVRVISRAAKLARFTRLFRLLRFIARAPRFLRFRKHLKPTKIRKVQPHERTFKSTLDFRVILLITVNSIMGTGIWFLTAAGAKYAGPASLISWTVLSVIAIYISMCFSELTSMFPKAGGVYEFAKQTYGRFWSFIIGWTTSIAGSVTIAMLLLGALQYMIPIKYSSLYIPIAILFILFFNFIAYRGMQTSTYMLVSFALITIITISSIIVPGFFHFSPENFTPFFALPAITILLGIFFIAETFFGWESAIFLSAETKNPRKNMPKALIGGTVIISIFSFLLALTSMGAIHWESYGQSIAPLKDLGGIYFGKIGDFIFTALVSTSIIGAVASWIVTAPRLLMALAEDKLFFVHFAKIHPKHNSPYVSILFQVVVISTLVVIGAGSYETLLHLLMPLILILYSAILLSVTILRVKKPSALRAYKAPLGKILPPIIVFFMAFLLVMYIRETHNAIDLLRISGSLIAFGVPAYFSIELFYDLKYIVLRKNLLAKLYHLHHKNPYVRPEFNRIIKYLDIPNKPNIILDYDCGVGAFARRIFRKKIPFKKLYAVDKSKEELHVFKKNIPEPLKDKVSLHFNKSWSLPKKIKHVDVFFGYNSLGHIDDIPKFINSLRKILSKNGRYCFYVKHTIINVKPNALILEKKKELLQLFAKERLTFNYVRKRRFLREELFIYGQKL